jgi:hypothetical protein
MKVDVSSLQPPAEEELTSRDGAIRYFVCSYQLGVSFEANEVLGFMLEANGEHLERVTLTYDAT